VYPAVTPNGDPDRLHCEVRPERRIVIVAPIGELDLGGVPTVDSELRELRDAGFEHLAVDLRGLRFIDSTGLHLLLRWSRAAASDGFRFSVIRGPERVQRVFEITGVAAALELVSEADLVD
jgi:anti-sigma B factor antagonist